MYPRFSFRLYQNIWKEHIYELPVTFFSSSSKNKKTRLSKKIFFMFQKVELSSPKIEKILIFSQKKVFLISRVMEFSRLELKKLPYIFGGNFPCSEIFFSAFKERSWHGLQINDLRKYFRRFFSEFGSWKCHLILRCFFLKVIDSHGFGGEILYQTRHCRLFYYRVCKVYAVVNHEISYEYSAEDLKTMLLKFPNFPIFWKPDK